MRRSRHVAIRVLVCISCLAMTAAILAGGACGARTGRHGGDRLPDRHGGDRFPCRHGGDRRRDGHGGDCLPHRRGGVGRERRRGRHPDCRDLPGRGPGGQLR